MLLLLQFLIIYCFGFSESEICTALIYIHQREHLQIHLLYLKLYIYKSFWIYAAADDSYLFSFI